MFRKYVLRLTWRVQIRPDGSAAVDDQRQLSDADAEEESFQAAMAHLQSLADCLEVIHFLMQVLDVVYSGHPLLPVQPEHATSIDNL